MENFDFSNKEEEVFTENNIPTYLQDFLVYYLDKKEEKQTWSGKNI